MTARSKTGHNATVHNAVASPRALGFLRRFLSIGDWHDIRLVMDLTERANIDPTDVFAALAVLHVDMRQVEGRFYEVRLDPTEPEPVETYDQRDRLLGSPSRRHRPNYYP